MPCPSDRHCDSPCCVVLHYHGRDGWRLAYGPCTVRDGWYNLGRSLGNLSDRPDALFYVDKRGNVYFVAGLVMYNRRIQPVPREQLPGYELALSLAKRSLTSKGVTT